MARMTYTATITCDGVQSEPLEITLEVSEVNGAKQGQGFLPVPPNLAGVVMNAAEHATVTTEAGDAFKILFSRVLFPECVAEFVTSGPLPEGRMVA